MLGRILAPWMLKQVQHDDYFCRHGCFYRQQVKVKRLNRAQTAAVCVRPAKDYGREYQIAHARAESRRAGDNND